MFRKVLARLRPRPPVPIMPRVRRSFAATASERPSAGTSSAPREAAAVCRRNWRREGWWRRVMGMLLAKMRMGGVEIDCMPAARRVQGKRVDARRQIRERGDTVPPLLGKKLGWQIAKEYPIWTRSARGRWGG